MSTGGKSSLVAASAVVTAGAIVVGVCAFLPWYKRRSRTGRNTSEGPNNEVVASKDESKWEALQEDSDDVLEPSRDVEEEVDYTQIKTGLSLGQELEIVVAILRAAREVAAKPELSLTCSRKLQSCLGFLSEVEQKLPDAEWRAGRSRPLLKLFEVAPPSDEEKVGAVPNGPLQMMMIDEVELAELESSLDWLVSPVWNADVEMTAAQYMNLEVRMSGRKGRD